MRRPPSSQYRYRLFRTDLKAGLDHDAAGKRDAAKLDGKPKKPKTPQEKAEVKARRRRYLRQYVDWLWPYRGPLAGLFGLAVLATVLSMVLPGASGLLVDKVLLNKGIPTARKIVLVNLVGLALVGILLGNTALSNFRGWWSIVLNAKVVYRLRRRMFARLVRLEMGTIRDFKTGGVVSRLSHDVDRVTDLVQNAIISPTLSLIRLSMAATILYAWNWRLATAASAILPPMALVSLIWVRKIRPMYRSMHKDHAEVDARVTETFGGLRVVRSFRREFKEERDYAVGGHTMLRKSFYARRIEIAMDLVWEITIPLVGLAILWVGSLLYLRDLATIGQIMAFQVYAMMLMGPVQTLVGSIGRLQQSLAAMDRVFEVLEKPIDKPDPPHALTAPRQVRDIRFDAVGFEYRKDLPVIQDFSVRVPGGSVVALVGPSGAGKTTITDLLARFHDPTHGSILLNGLDLRRIKLNSYRQLLAVVEQEVFLFDGTVAENIAYGRRDADMHDIIEASRRANADIFIRELPEKYDTLIGERGLKLSGGQRQRLSIARALLADPQILILDEATSNLDTESEQLIQAALWELYRNRTTFVIAHRLSTVTHAQLIVVLDKGRIVEMGSHAELMAQSGGSGMYRKMVSRQQQAFGAPVDAFDWNPPAVDRVN